MNLSFTPALKLLCRKFLALLPLEFALRDSLVEGSMNWTLTPVRNINPPLHLWSSKQGWVKVRVRKSVRGRSRSWKLRCSCLCIKLCIWFRNSVFLTPLTPYVSVLTAQAPFEWLLHLRMMETYFMKNFLGENSSKCYVCTQYAKIQLLFFFFFFCT